MLEPSFRGLSCSPFVSPGLSACKGGTASLCHSHLVLQLLPWLLFSPPWLPIFSPPTSLDECFFFNSLVVGLPYSSIFCQFLLFFVFNFVVVFLSVVEGGKLYLPTPPSWLEVLNFFYLLTKVYSLLKFHVASTML